RHDGAARERPEEDPGEGRRVREDDENALAAPHADVLEERREGACALGDELVGVATVSVADGDLRPEPFADAIEKEIPRQIEVFGKRGRGVHAAAPRGGRNASPPRARAPCLQRSSVSVMRRVNAALRGSPLTLRRRSRGAWRTGADTR